LPIAGYIPLVTTRLNTSVRQAARAGEPGDLAARSVILGMIGAFFGRHQSKKINFLQ
jgi:hypothetical protein